MNKVTWILVGILILVDVWIVWNTYWPKEHTPDNPSSGKQIIYEEAVTTSTSTTQNDCDIANTPMKCDKERVLAALGNPTLDERRGAIIEGETFNTYRNEFWGFQFEYPTDWEVKEYVFGSASSLFNLSVDPIEGQKCPETIMINVTHYGFMEAAVVRNEEESDPNFITTETTFQSLYALWLVSTVYGLPSKGYLIPIDHLYWINIDMIEDEKYNHVWNEVTDSFQFIPINR